MSVRTPTRERLVTEAMKLFSQKGFDATSVSQIEAAAGLAVGSGALYHHFKSKEALLEAGVDRQLDRRRAMTDIRAVFAGLGDMHTELVLLGRYLLGMIDEETELLQIAARTTSKRSARLDQACAVFIDALNNELAGWVSAWAPTLPASQTRGIAHLGINSLLGDRLAKSLLHNPAVVASDEDYLSEWTAVLSTRISALTN